MRAGGVDTPPALLYNRFMQFSLTGLLAGLALFALPLMAAAAPPSRLHAQGTQIVDAAGKAVVLRGVNLGGWLIEEPWMMPLQTRPPDGSALPPLKDHASLGVILEKRFGTAGAARVQTAFQDAWVNESDFDRMQKAGVNCVRLPFLAGQIAEPTTLAKIDQAVTWASARGMYVVLDMHGAPGSQSDQGHTGKADRNEFFKDPANVARAEALWTQIARRYKDNPAVAGYDLLNEPTGTPNSDTLYVVTDRLYRAVRAADPTHLVFIEDGYTGVQWMPFPGPCGWTNVVYSTHYYRFEAKSADGQRKEFTAYLASAMKERDLRKVPFYVGEFGFEPHGDTTVEANAVQKMNAGGVSWSAWTYKVIFGGGNLTLWSLIGNSKPVEKLDPYADSEAELIRKSAAVRSENLAQNNAVAAAFR